MRRMHDLEVYGDASIAYCSQWSSLLVSLIYPSIQDITSYGILYTLNHIVTRMPKISMLEDQNSTRLGQNVVSLHHVVRMESGRATL